MKLEFTMKNSKLRDLFSVFASDEDLSKHLESIDVSGYYETIKTRSYKISISTNDPVFVNKISNVLKGEKNETVNN